MARFGAVDSRLRPISTGAKGQSARASGRKPDVIQLDDKPAALSFIVRHALSRQSDCLDIVPFDRAMVRTYNCPI